MKPQDAFEDLGMKLEDSSGQPPSKNGCIIFITLAKWMVEDTLW
jgi:hypothetical protein